MFLRKFKATVLLALASLSLFSCSSPTQVPSNSGSGGTLSLSLTNAVNARTLAPTIDMNVASYTVTGTGPASSTFTQSTTGTSLTVSGLAFGTWTLVVTAYNSAGNLIGSGTATAQVYTGSATTASITVTPVVGTGTLTLGISWPQSQVQTPSISASLTPALGTAQTLAFTMLKGGNALYSNSAVANGYYTLAFTLQDTGIVVAGAVDVVRIVTGQTTSGTYTFSQVNAPGGAIQVNLSANMQNPLSVAISGATPTLAQGSNETLTASVSNYTGNVVYVWYVNGVSVGTGSSFTFGSGTAIGYSYRIDVTAFSADGTQAGSATTSVQTTSASIAQADYTSNLGTLKYVPAGALQYDGTAGDTDTETAFRMSQNLIARAQFLAIMGTDPSVTTASTGTNDPVQNVNWYQGSLL
jgi:hypothetical protein